MADQRRSEERDGGRERAVFSRSTAACNACRGKKQKCGGQRPVCARCRMIEQPCIWPQQKKRGPSKGYNEALEARLNETEQVLFKLLSCVSSRQLSQALGGHNWPHAAEIGDEEGHLSRASMPGAMALDKEAVMEYWVQYPLKTTADVQAWHKDHYKSYEPLPVHEYPPDDMDPDQDLTLLNSGQLSNSSNNSDAKNANNYNNDSNFHGAVQLPEPSRQSSGPGTMGRRVKTAPTAQDIWGSFTHNSDGQYQPSSSRGRTGERDTTISPLPVGSGGIAPKGIEPQDIPAESASIGFAGLGLSQEFQDKFLW